MAVKRITAEQEYKKDPKLSRESVSTLLDWARKQPHLPEISEEKAILFLSSCFYSIERAKITADNYYTFRTHVPEFFAKRDPKDIQSQIGLEFACYLGLPGLTDDGSKAYYSCLMDTDVAKFSLATAMKCHNYSTDIGAAEEGAWSGYRIILDLKGITFGHIARIGPLTVKKLLAYLQEAMPVRLKGIHFATPGPFMEKVLSLIRPFLNKSTAESIFIHNTYEDLHKYVPRRMLPKEAGGDLAETEYLHKQCVEIILANRDYLMAEETERVREALRQGKAKNAGDLFGTEGSFKKLEID